MNPKTPGVRLHSYQFRFIIFIRCPSTSSSFWETAWSSLRCRSRWSWPWTSATRLGREWWDTFSKLLHQIWMSLDADFMYNRSFSGWWLDLYLVQHHHCSLPCTLRHPRHRSSFDWSLNWATRYIANLALARSSQIRLKNKVTTQWSKVYNRFVSGISWLDYVLPISCLLAVPFIIPLRFAA